MKIPAVARDFLTRKDLALALPATAHEPHEAAERQALHVFEELLLGSEEGFRRAFSVTPQPMWVYDRQTLAFLAVNDAAIAQYGYSREEFLRLCIPDIQPFHSRSAGQLAAGTRQATQWQHRLKDGRVMAVEIVSHPVRFAGRAAGLMVVTAVPEHGRDQEARARLATIVDCCDDAIIGLGPDGISESWNAGATRLFGYSAAEAIGRHIGILAPADRAAEIAQLLDRLGRGEALSHYDTAWVRKDGSAVEVSLSISPIRDSSGRILGAATVARDSGDRVRAQREAEQVRAQSEDLARLRDDFVTSVSHELRTPLTAIVGYAELLQSRWAQIPEAKRLDYIGRIAGAANRQVRLVEDLLLVSGLEAQMPPRRETVVLRTLLQRVAQETQASYHGQRIALTGPADLAALADPRRVAQIMANLLDNAAKYSPQGCTIHVHWRRKRGQALVRVRDEGSGIAKQRQAVLFTRFGRLPDSRMRAGRVGMGLGLFLARRLARAMGGDLDLEETGPGGSTFRLQLPAIPHGCATSKSRTTTEGDAPCATRSHPSRQVPRRRARSAGHYPGRAGACATCAPQPHLPATERQAGDDGRHRVAPQPMAWHVCRDVDEPVEPL